METNIDLDSILQRIVGKECSSVIAGAGSGSIVNIGFGELRRRKVPVSNNPTLDERDKYFDSELQLFVHSAWRIIKDGRVHAGWRDAALEDGQIYSQLKNFVGKKVVSITVDKVTNDVCIHFHAGSAFNVLCDITNSDEADSNFDFFTQEEIYSVAIDGSIFSESRKKTY